MSLKDYLWLLLARTVAAGCALRAQPHFTATGPFLPCRARLAFDMLLNSSHGMSSPNYSVIRHDADAFGSCRKRRRSEQLKADARSITSDVAAGSTRVMVQEYSHISSRSAKPEADIICFGMVGTRYNKRCPI